MAKFTETDVLALYEKKYGTAFTEVRFLSGDVNKTYLLKDDDGNKVIFQKLAGIFNETLVDDFCVISDHLSNDNWEVPKVIRDKKGSAYIKDLDGNVWRAISFIESEGKPSNVDPQAIGGILAKLHKSLSKLEYEPKFTLPHFHDTSYYLEKLKAILGEFEEEDRVIAEKIIKEYESLPDLPKAKTQLIHADARVANILFRDGAPFTFIDFDTIMRSTIWVEIGDLVRSMVERDVQDSNKTDVKALHQLGHAYLKQSGLKMSDVEFYGYMLTSGRIIALELAMRFMIDIIEDYYFVWENTQYGSRHEHSIARVKQQLEVSRRFRNAQNEN